MNAFNSSNPTAQPTPPIQPTHPLLNESNIELLSLKIGPTLKLLIAETAKKNQFNVNIFVRNILAEAVQPTVEKQIVVASSPAPVAPPQPQLSEVEKTYSAFENETVMRAIQSVAQGIDNASIECTAEAILEHFISFCPIIKG